tara:strand:+ start:1174 stop:2082 length:909 start_codon:yes stop_codon:yes gene_type:complete
MVNTSIIIPAYNEAKTLPLLVSKINQSLTVNKIDGEIILVDDGSSDNTKEVAEELTKKYKVLHFYSHPINKGLTQALLTCFHHSKGKVIVFLPADLESDPEEDIPKLMNKMNKGYNLVAGWRQNRKGTKVFASKIYNILSRILFRIKLHDLNWIKAFDRKIINDLSLRSDWHRYIPIIAHSKGYKIGEVKVNVHKRRFGKSKFGIKRLLIGALDLLVVKFNLSFSERPMLVFGSIGILLSLAGFISGLYLIYIKLLTGIIGNRAPLIFLTVLLILLGIQFFALGFISEFLVDIKESIKNKRK